MTTVKEKLIEVLETDKLQVDVSCSPIPGYIGVPFVKLRGPSPDITGFSIYIKDPLDRLNPQQTLNVEVNFNSYIQQTTELTRWAKSYEGVNDLVRLGYLLLRLNDKSELAEIAFKGLEACDNLQGVNTIETNQYVITYMVPTESNEEGDQFFEKYVKISPRVKETGVTTVKQNLINVLGVSEDKVGISWSLTERDVISFDINRLGSGPSENGIVISIPDFMGFTSTARGLDVVIDLNWVFNNIPQFSEWANRRPKQCKLEQLIKLSYLFLKLSTSKDEVIQKTLSVLEKHQTLQELNTLKIGDYEVSYTIPYEKCSTDEFFERFVGIKPITKGLESDNKPVNEESISEVPDIDLTKIPNSDNEIVNVVMKDGKYVLEFRKEFLSRRDLVDFTTKLLNS